MARRPQKGPEGRQGAPGVVPDLIRHSAAALAGRRSRPVWSVLGLVLLFLVSLWAATGLYLHSERNARLAFSQRVTLRLTESAEAQVRMRFRNAEVFLSMVREWVERNPGRDIRVDRTFHSMLQQTGVVAGLAVDLRVLDADGLMHFLTYDFPERHIQVTEAEYFQQALTSQDYQVVFGRPVYCSLRERWILPLAMALPANAGRQAVAMLAIDLDALHADLDPQRLTPGSGVALIRADGVMLARVPLVEAMLGVSVANNTLFREHLPREKKAVRRFRTDATDNAERQVGYTALADYPLVVVVATSVDDVLADWGELRLNLLLAAAGISLLACWVGAHLLRLLQRLDRRQDELERLASVDAMTGTLNRAAFMAALVRESERATRYDTALSLMMFDLDYFKRLNDGYGHALGDQALKAFATAIANELRTVDAFGRIGGEEFAALLPNTDLAAAAQLAERLRQLVAQLVVYSEAGDAVRFTVSVGVAQRVMAPVPERGDALLRRADDALYAAKRQGRNRVVRAAAVPADGTIAVETSPPAQTTESGSP